MWMHTGPFPAKNLAGKRGRRPSIRHSDRLFYGQGKTASAVGFFRHGFCGGFTTMSTFSKETVMLLQTQSSLAVLYMAVSLISGIVLALIGVLAGRRIAGIQQRKGRRKDDTSGYLHSGRTWCDVALLAWQCHNR
ncbi:CrcB family protein [Bacillus inaquosorum]|nr:CrcB family protein [Bacillus inaquosorum]